MSKKKYEALVIFSAAVRDDGLEAAVGRFADELKALGAEIESTEALGRRTFARTLAKRDAGLYAKVRFDAEPDATLASKWGLTPENTYSPAVLAWLFNEYPGCGPDDLSSAIYRDLSGASKIPLTLTEMYWLNIPPVHADPVYGGSNIWFVAGMGSLVSGNEPDVEPHVTLGSDGSVESNVFMTVTMMITNTSPLAAGPRAWPPDRLNGHVYDGQGSAAWSGGQPAWTSAVFNIVGALQKPGIGDQFRVLQQYTFKPGSFGAADDPQHPFQTRVEVTDPFAPNSMGAYYQWSSYRDIHPVWYRWVIKPNPEEYRLSIVPLAPNWGMPSVTDP